MRLLGTAKQEGSWRALRTARMALGRKKRSGGKDVLQAKNVTPLL